jgi:hypothetical protein
MNAFLRADLRVFGIKIFIKLYSSHIRGKLCENWEKKWHKEFGHASATKQVTYVLKVGLRETAVKGGGVMIPPGLWREPCAVVPTSLTPWATAVVSSLLFDY